MIIKISRTNDTWYTVLGKVSDLNDYVNEYDEALICCLMFQEKATSIKSARLQENHIELYLQLRKLFLEANVNQIKEVSIIDLLEEMRFS